MDYYETIWDYARRARNETVRKKEGKERVKIKPLPKEDREWL